jgi:chemotaxis protein MotB
MRRPPKHRPHSSHDRWLVSYADFITLLFAFFVVLYSVAQVDRKKIVELAESIQQAFGNPQTPSANRAPVILQVPGGEPAKILTEIQPPPNSDANRDLTDLRKELEQALAEQIAQGEVSIRNSPEGLVISLQEAGFFESGSAEIRSTSQPVFGRIAAMLSARGCQVRIEGHTDNVPIHNPQFDSNWELSTSRATEVVRQFITQYQFSPELLSAAGYAQYHPVANNDTAEGRAKNRRVDVVIVAERKVSARGQGSASILRRGRNPDSPGAPDRQP